MEEVKPEDIPVDAEHPTIRMYTITESTPSRSTLDKIESRMENMHSKEGTVKMEKRADGVMLNVDSFARGSNVMRHESVGMAETMLFREYGIAQKSSLLSYNQEGKTLQSTVDILQGEFTEEALEEIENTISFATQQDFTVDVLDNTLYMDPGDAYYSHRSLDITLTVCSKIAFKLNNIIADNVLVLNDPI